MFFFWLWCWMFFKQFQTYSCRFLCRAIACPVLYWYCQLPKLHTACSTFNVSEVTTADIRKLREAKGQESPKRARVVIIPWGATVSNCFLAILLWWYVQLPKLSQVSTQLFLKFDFWRFLTMYIPSRLNFLDEGSLAQDLLQRQRNCLHLDKPASRNHVYIPLLTQKGRLLNWELYLWLVFGAWWFYFVSWQFMCCGRDCGSSATRLSPRIPCTMPHR